MDRVLADACQAPSIALFQMGSWRRRIGDWLLRVHRRTLIASDDFLAAFTNASCASFRLPQGTTFQWRRFWRAASRKERRNSDRPWRKRALPSAESPPPSMYTATPLTGCRPVRPCARSRRAGTSSARTEACRFRGGKAATRRPRSHISLQTRRAR